MSVRKLALLSASLAGLLLVGCDTVDDLIRPSAGPPLPGKREAVLARSNALQADTGIAGLTVTLPPMTANADWPQRGGTPEHAPGHPALSASPKEAFHASVGSGSSSSQSLLGVPVVAGGRIYAVDSDSNAVALDVSSGGKVWSTSLEPEKARDNAMGGGVAYADGRVYATTGYGEVLALDAGTGAIVWRKRLSGPVRGAPTVAGGRVYAITLDNQLSALAAGDGNVLWSYTAMQESADLLGASSPAVTALAVFAPFSSGELAGIRIDSGRPVWQEGLANMRPADAMSNLAAIRGLPVVDHGLVFAVSHSGRTVALDERSGGRVWELPLGGSQTPWVAGDFVFLVGNGGELVSVTRKDGRVRWVQQLVQYEEPERRRGIVTWIGPVLAGGKLWLTNSRGEMVAFSPADGSELGTYKLPAPTFLPPVVAGGTLYVLSDNGTLTAFR